MTLMEELVLDIALVKVVKVTRYHLGHKRWLDSSSGDGPYDAPATVGRMDKGRAPTTRLNGNKGVVMRAT
jgi:hypothetical protein